VGSCLLDLWGGNLMTSRVDLDEGGRELKKIVLLFLKKEE